ncbi:GNAT family N-acetyltransferase [Vibrio sp. E150_011]
MIRPYGNNDSDTVLAIWLQASIKAHDFVPPEFWVSQVDVMRDTYLPVSMVYVYEWADEVVGFYALYEDTLAAIFVAPEKQGQGIGKQLINHAKQQSLPLTLNVYKANNASVQFYLSQGFIVVSEQEDEHTGHPEYSMRFTA